MNYFVQRLAFSILSLFVLVVISQDMAHVLADKWAWTNLS